MTVIPDAIRDRLDQLPTVPGVYLMHDAEGRIIYIGKAKVLRNRVRSYWHAAAGHVQRTRPGVTLEACEWRLVDGHVRPPAW